MLALELHAQRWALLFTTTSSSRVTFSGHRSIFTDEKNETLRPTFTPLTRKNVFRTSLGRICGKFFLSWSLDTVFISILSSNRNQAPSNDIFTLPNLKISISSTKVQRSASFSCCLKHRLFTSKGSIASEYLWRNPDQSASENPMNRDNRGQSRSGSMSSVQNSPEFPNFRYPKTVSLPKQRWTLQKKTARPRLSISCPKVEPCVTIYLAWSRYWYVSNSEVR